MKKVYLLIIAIIFCAQSTDAQVNVAGNNLQFNGTNCVNLGNIDFQLSNALSIMAWVRWDSLPTNSNPWANMLTMNSATNPDDGQFWIQHNSNNTKFEFALTTYAGGNKSRSFIQSSTQPIQGIWYHIAAVFNGSQMILYVNGISEASQNKAGPIYPKQSNYQFTIGSWASSNSLFRRFEGCIDEVSIWNIALSQSDILSKKNTLLSGSELGLMAYWRFDNINNPLIIDDLSPSGFTFSTASMINCPAPAQIPSNAPIYSGLPIELLYFQGECGNDSVAVLKWATGSEIQNDYFSLYRSTDGIEWIKIAQIEGSGNSNSVNNYEFTDNDPQLNKAFYKLTQTDFDGQSETFDLVSIYCKLNLRQIKLYPNPVSDAANFSFYNAQENNNPMNILLYNGSGQLVSSYQFPCELGINNMHFDVSLLPPGTYYFQAIQGSDYFFSNPLIVSRQ